MPSKHSIQDYIDTTRQGIAKKFGTGKPKRVLIVGAGLAGLVAGYELKKAGHTPVILEAQQRGFACCDCDPPGSIKKTRQVIENPSGLV